MSVGKLGSRCADARGKVKSAFGDEIAETIDFALAAGARVEDVAVTTDAPVGVRLHIKAVSKIKTAAFFFEPRAHALTIAQEEINNLRAAHGKASHARQTHAFRSFFLDPTDWHWRRDRHWGEGDADNDTLLNRHLRNLNRGRHRCSRHRPTARRHQRKNQQGHNSDSISATRCVSTVEPAINPPKISLPPKDVDRMNGQKLAPRDAAP